MCLIFLFRPLVWHNALRRACRFLFQFLDHRFLRHFPDDFAFAEQEAFAACAGNPDIGFARFSGTVDGTAENGNFDRRLDFSDIIFDFIGDADQIDFDPAASRAGNQCRCIGSEPERFQELLATFTSSTGSALKEIRNVLPIPFERIAPRPAALFTVPANSVPDSVMPK